MAERNISTKELFVAFDGKCIRLTRNVCIEVPSLNSNQEEADTRLILHAKHAAPSCESVVVVSEDTDVLIISLVFDHDIDCNMWHTNQDEIHQCDKASTCFRRQCMQGVDWLTCIHGV